MTLAVEPKLALPGIGMVGSENTYLVCEDGAAQSLTGSPQPLRQLPVRD
jgi:Xaa-Pro aminopeptidase